MVNFASCLVQGGTAQEELSRIPSAAARPMEYGDGRGPELKRETREHRHVRDVLVSLASAAASGPEKRNGAPSSLASAAASSSTSPGPVDGYRRTAQARRRQLLEHGRADRLA